MLYLVIFFEFIKYLKYLECFFVYFLGMMEFYFFNYGLLERIVFRIIGILKGDMEKGFVWVV